MENTTGLWNPPVLTLLRDCTCSLRGIAAAYTACAEFGWLRRERRSVEWFGVTWSIVETLLVVVMGTRRRIAHQTTRNDFGIYTVCPVTGDVSVFQGLTCASLDGP